jgi:hypothetical protein
MRPSSARQLYSGPALLLLWVAAFLYCGMAQAQSDFHFGVIAHAMKMSDVGPLREAIAETDTDNLAFVVVNGIKPAAEPCIDPIYEQRRDLLDEAKNGLVVSLAASDWASCKNSVGRSGALDRRDRVRELFFNGEYSLGGTRLPLLRQSSATKFRAYVENTRWEIGSVLFVTLDLPANNNNFLPGAGRNSEFEDRLIANHEWLQRVFTIASRKKMRGVVLFVDGNPFGENMSLRDGYAEVRKQILAIAAAFKGRLLLVHGQNAAGTAAISWQKNLGIVGAGNGGANEGKNGWLKLAVHPASADLFELAPDAASDKKSQ